MSFHELKLLWQLRKAKQQFEKETQMAETGVGPDPIVSVKKGIQDALVTAATVGGLAIAAYFSDSENVRTVLNHAGLSVTLAALLVPLVSGTMTALVNYLRHK